MLSWKLFLTADKNEAEGPVSAGILSLSQNEYGTIFTVPISEEYNTFLPNYQQDQMLG